MTDLRVLIEGDDAQHVADELNAVLASGATVAPAPRAETGFEHARKIVDPISLLTLILTIPGTLLTTMDLVDRVRKRHTAKKLIETARRLSHEKNVALTCLEADGTAHSFDRLEPDTLLDVANRSK